MKRKTGSWRHLFAVLCLGMAGALLSYPAVASTGLTELSIEELMNIEVTSVTKKPQKLYESAAAIYVITQEDIRRSGMTNIPELLRLVPGLNVAQIGANKWAISSRGFNGLYANKLLVLIDGRTVYSPLFNGVFWDVQDTPLEDIERIEVIRGPGGTLWGANAVNGIINIITKLAKDTQGGMVSAGAGNLAHDDVTVRYGGKLNDPTYYRLYGKHFDRTGFTDAAGKTTDDAWRHEQGGFRIDREMPDGGALTLEGEAYAGRTGEMFITPSLAPPYVNAYAEDANLDGSHLLANWHRFLAGGGDISLQAYYDYTSRQSTLITLKRATYDLDFQHRLPWGERHKLIWGVGYRVTHDDNASGNSVLISFIPPSKTLYLPSAFVQDESEWWDGRLRVTVGSKFERNDYTGMEYQPNLRVLWKAAESHTLWGAVSRAVRTPSRGETAINDALQAFPSPTPGVTGLVVLFRNPELESERLTAYEIGYRGHLRNGLSLDATAFYNDYAQLLTYEPGVTFLETTLLPPHLVVPLNTGNLAYGQVYGSEVAVNWQAVKRWRLAVSFSLLRFDLQLEPGSGDVSVRDIPETSPQQQWQLHSYLDLPGDLNLDAGIYYVDGLSSQNIPSYTRLDLRLGWKPFKDMELSLAGQNLANNHHPEFTGNNFGLGGSEVPRSVYGKVTWRF